MAVNEKTIETLIEAVRKVSASLDLDEVLDTIFDSLKELINYSAAIIFVLDLRSGAVHEMKARGYPPDSVGEGLLSSGIGIIGWVFKNARGQIINDVKRDTRYIKA